MTKQKNATKKVESAPDAKTGAAVAEAQADADGGSGAEVPQIGPVDLERIIELDFVRTTEAAALNAYRWMGKGDALAAHAAAVDAIRGTLDLTSVSATTVFGDGLKPQPGGIEPGEKLGNWADGSLEIDLALVPIDGIEIVARGYWGAVAAMVASRREDNVSALMHIPCRYVTKLAYGPIVESGPEQVHLDASVRDNLEIIAMKLGKRVQDLTVAVLDRPRHQQLIHDIRAAGASARLFRDGDITLCMAPSLPDTAIDVYMGIGGATEAVMAAAAIKCLNGNILVKLAPQDEQETQAVVEVLGKDSLEQHFRAEDLARGDGVIFCATGITDGSILRGIHIDGTRATTSSVVMRSRYRTVRKVSAVHDLASKTIRLRSANAEAKL